MASEGDTKKQVNAEPVVMIPNLFIDGRNVPETLCEGCQTSIQGIQFSCQECPQFNLCSTCMYSTLCPHEDHRFKASGHNDIYLRKYSQRPQDDPISDNKGLAVAVKLNHDGKDEQSSYQVGTRYTDVYMGYHNDVIGKFSSNSLHTQRFDTPRNLPVIERITTHYTNLRNKPSQKFLEMLSAKHVSVRVTVHSVPILNILRATVEYYPGYGFGEHSLVNMNAQILLLAHHHRQLLDYKNHHPQNHSPQYVEECNSHIDKVVHFLEGQYGSTLVDFEERLLEPEPTIPYKDLGLLFKPGMEIYTWDGADWEPCIVSSFTDKHVDSSVKQLNPLNPTLCTRIVAWNLDFDGTTFGRALKTFDIKPFRDERKIRTLPCFPVSLDAKTEEGILKRQRLVERGKKFFDFAKGPVYLEYHGQTRDSPKRKYTSTRVICDTSCEPWIEVAKTKDEKAQLEIFRPRLNAFTREIVNLYRGCMCLSCAIVEGPARKGRPYAAWDSIDRKMEGLEERQYFLCSGKIWGYILNERVWRLLDVDCLREPRIEPDLIQQLVLEEPKTKELIKAICDNYTSKEADRVYSADFIQGKGEGHIFLLHGPPGVGKTLTAECVAEFTRRPLLSLTGGDIGSTPEAVEENLRKFLRRGEDWNAVVLLDEADVYLSSREHVGIERNSVVSVFIREIEYYRGILFLTTNRVGLFDEAIISRIHFPLHFGPFTDDSRMKVWLNNLDRLEDERSDVIEVHYNLRDYVREKLAKLPWNGREIRNGIPPRCSERLSGLALMIEAFSTAVSLAIYNAHLKTVEKLDKAGQSHKVVKPVLKIEHLEDVITMTENFKKYITTTHQGDDPASLARQKHLRVD
ncbi:MAG: hypothetical protein M1820_000561 [Bogoriella megaspora]|nr:MAG: hypothetical protein M1820_000561 [Bogoriella megaspora]